MLRSLIWGHQEAATGVGEGDGPRAQVSEASLGWGYRRRGWRDGVQAGWEELKADRGGGLKRNDPLLGP